MQTLSIREIRAQLGSLDQLIAEEHELIITRHNKPLARILPIQGVHRKPDHQSLRDSLPYQEISSETLQAMDRDER